MDEEGIEKLNELREMMSVMNEAMDAINRVVDNPHPDPDDIAFLNAFACGLFNDEDDEPSDEDWVDDTWDEALQMFPYQLLLTSKL